MQKLIKKGNWVLDEYLQYVSRHPPPLKRKSLDLLEVYANERSQLTKSAIQRKGKGLRFTMALGDLGTPAGRYKLYDVLREYVIKHIWLAPECKAWCAWNRFNMMTGVKSMKTILQKQAEQKVHLLLCSVLMYHQTLAGDHFHVHLEQPQTSSMLKQPELGYLMQFTSGTNCDMCQFGLTHPTTNDAMRKRTHIRSTSAVLLQHLSTYKCSGDHAHVPLAGSHLTQFAENYPPQFADTVADYILTGNRYEKRVTNPEVYAVAEVPGEGLDVPLIWGCVHDELYGPRG